jgi:hypothetical protein
MIAVLVMADDVAVGLGGAGGYLEMKRLQTADHLQYYPSANGVTRHAHIPRNREARMSAMDY